MPPAICTAQMQSAAPTTMATFGSCHPQAGAGGPTPTSTTLPATGMTEPTHTPAWLSPARVDTFTVRQAGGHETVESSTRSTLAPTNARNDGTLGAFPR